MIISNSTPIIHLGKVGYLDLLQKCFRKIIMPEEVFLEISAVPESAEAILLHQALTQKWAGIEKVPLAKELEPFSALDVGELKAISLALQKKKPLLIDDKAGRQAAVLFQVEAHGTLYVVLEAYRRKFVSRDKAIEIVNSMIRNEFYLSSDVYVLFLELIEEK